LPKIATAAANAYAEILGVILKLPPLKQALAGRQFKSKYLKGLIRRQKIVS
jgi:hypothetical protein